MRPITTHTVQSLKDRTIEVGNCWEWQGYFGNGTPQVFHKGEMISVRRVFTELFGGQISKGYYVPKCDNKTCVNPDHVVFHTVSYHLKKAAKTAALNPTRAIKIQIHKRATVAKLNQEKADEIRCSDEPSRELAKKYGVDKSVICRIRAGKAWINLNNPFAGLM